MGTDKEDTDPSSPSALRPNSQPGLGAAVGPRLAGSPAGPADDRSRPRTAFVRAAPRRPAGRWPSRCPRPRCAPGRVRARSRPPSSPRSPPPVSMTPSPTKDSVELLARGHGRAPTGPAQDDASERRGGVGGLSRGAPRSSRAHVGAGGPEGRGRAPGGPVRANDAERANTSERPRRAPRRGRAESREALSTFVPARVLRRRVAMAIVAGILIVLLSFMALRLTGRGDSAGPADARSGDGRPDRAESAGRTRRGGGSPSGADDAGERRGRRAGPSSRVDPGRVDLGRVDPGGVDPAAETHADDSRPAAPRRSPAGATTRHHHDAGRRAGRPGRSSASSRPSSERQLLRPAVDRVAKGTSW